jgi:hypothetical protein
LPSRWINRHLKDRKAIAQRWLAKDSHLWRGNPNQLNVQVRKFADRKQVTAQLT